MQIEVSDKPHVEGQLPTHPQVIGYWVMYFAKRIRAAFDDEIDANDFREWLYDTLNDLESVAEVDCQITEENTERATKLAEAMQEHIFHNGPDPDEDETLQAECAPNWKGVFPCD